MSRQRFWGSILIALSCGCDEAAVVRMPTAPTPPITTTPVEMMTISGTVSEPDGRPIADARVTGQPGSAFTHSDTEGRFSFSAPRSSTAVLVSAAGFESGRASWPRAADAVAHVKLQREIRLAPGVSTTFTLYRLDPPQDPTMGTGIWCEPCKLVRVLSERQQVLEATVRWERAAAITLWLPGSPGVGASGDSFETRARFTALAGETILYVGAAAYSLPIVTEPVRITLDLREP